MEQVFGYIIALGASVMMPIIFTIIGMCIGYGFQRRIKICCQQGGNYA